MRPLTLLLDVHFGGAVLRAARFGLVGASGLVVNQLLLAAFTELGSVHYVVAAVFATQGSTTWNFALSNSWVFNDRSPRRSALVRLAQCLVVNNAMLLGRGPLLVAMTEGLGIHYLVSNVVTLVMFTLIRYVLADRWIWVRTGSTLCAAYDYDVHGIIRIASDACLPELAYFQTSHPIERPDVRVHVGRPAAPAVGAPEPAGPNHRLLRYQEVLRQFGFWVEIAYGESVEVTVSPLLRFSGHVLYTNVVEPLLRWMLVQRGYALMHGACIKLANGALLITARTDTGKTSTILHLLAQHNLGFLSDDMVILRPDGRALCYPKPLTISRHTLSSPCRRPFAFTSGTWRLRSCAWLW